jgi:hypothetical protein
MITHHDNQAHRLVNNLWAEMALFAALVVILITPDIKIRLVNLAAL